MALRRMYCRLFHLPVAYCSCRYPDGFKAMHFKGIGRLVAVRFADAGASCRVVKVCLKQRTVLGGRGVWAVGVCRAA